MRFDPFREFDRLSDEFDRLTPRGTGFRSMPMDAVRRGNHVIARIDVPGVRPEDVEVTVERNVLTVSATRSADHAEEDQPLVAERRHGEFRRQLFLGDTLDASRVEADVTDGVLTLRIPVAETAKPRKVEISSGATAHDGEDAQPAISA